MITWTLYTIFIFLINLIDDISLLGNRFHFIVLISTYFKQLLLLDENKDETKHKRKLAQYQTS